MGGKNEGSRRGRVPKDGRLPSSTERLAALEGKGGVRVGRNRRRNRDRADSRFSLIGYPTIRVPALRSEATGIRAPPGISVVCDPGWERYFPGDPGSGRLDLGCHGSRSLLPFMNPRLMLSSALGTPKPPRSHR